MFRIEVKEITREVRDVNKYQKVHDAVDANDERGQYGYVTTREMVKDERVVLTQEVENVDLKALIRAINRPT